MALENLTELVEAARTELNQVGTAGATVDGSRSELEAAQAEVTAKQTALDEARSTLATEKQEAIAALRAIVEAVNAEIANLEPPA